MLNIVNNWWSNVPFDIMKEITGFRMIDFSPEDGYQEFVDACNDWWNG